MNLKTPTAKQLAPTIASLFTATLFTINAKLTAEWVKRGLQTCFTTVIPSLFPYIVISEILCACGGLDYFSKPFSKVAKKLWGISEKSSAAVLSGLILGFPIGTRALARLKDNGEISENELSHAIGFCGIPSFGFTVNAVGISLFSSKAFGYAAFFISFISAITTALVFKRSSKSDFFYIPTQKENKKSSAEIITGAISSATRATITLCAYVVFFSALVGSFSESVTSPLAAGVIGSLLELSTGIASDAHLGGRIGIALCGFALGWSGISVHLQAMALLADRVKSYKVYFSQKLFQGALCSVGLLIYSFITDFTPPTYGDIPAISGALPSEYAVFVLILFFFCIFSCKKKLFPL